MENTELKSIQSSGKSVDEAIFKGLQKLEISIDEVSIEIIQTETKGILGIGAKPAIVKLTQRPAEEFEVPDYIRKADERFEKNRERFDRKAEKAAEKEARKEKKNAEKHKREEEKNELRRKNEKPVKREEPVKEAAPVKEEPVNEAPEAAPAEKEQPARAEERGERRDNRRPRREKSERREPAERVQAPAKEPEKVINYTLEEAEGNPAAEFVKGLIEHMGAEATVLAAHDEDCLRLRIDSETMGMLIGHRGETLDAMQYLTGLVINKNRKTEGYTRVTLNTEEYREKREETLKRLAKKVAAQVRATGRPRALEPMNPYERRVLHSTLQNNPDVTTHSEGEEPNRRVVVTPRRKGRGYTRTRGPRQNAPRSNAGQNDGGENDVISREEYERLYAAARAANPMFSSKPADKKDE